MWSVLLAVLAVLANPGARSTVSEAPHPQAEAGSLGRRQPR
jgi:hypothetical protein